MPTLLKAYSLRADLNPTVNGEPISISGIPEYQALSGKQKEIRNTGPGAQCLWGDQRVPTARQAQRPCCLALKRIQNRPLCRHSRGLQLLRGSVCTGALHHFILVSVHPHGGGKPRTTRPGASRCGRRGGSSEPQRPKGRPEADVPALTPLCVGTLDSRASLG